jgi:hypothetical protein
MSRRNAADGIFPANGMINALSHLEKRRATERFSGLLLGSRKQGINQSADLPLITLPGWWDLPYFLCKAPFTLSIASSTFFSTLPTPSLTSPA